MKFSIRDLFLVTMIVALAVGWWVDRRGLHQKIESQNQTIESQNQQLLVVKAKEAMTDAVAEAKAAVEAAMKESLDTLPNSSPPTPNPLRP